MRAIHRSSYMLCTGAIGDIIIITAYIICYVPKTFARVYIPFNENPFVFTQFGGEKSTELVETRCGIHACLCKKKYIYNTFGGTFRRITRQNVKKICVMTCVRYIIYYKIQCEQPRGTMRHYMLMTRKSRRRGEYSHSVIIIVMEWMTTCAVCVRGKKKKIFFTK